MRLLYTIGIYLYYLAALVLSIWNSKAAKWISGRRFWRQKLKGVFAEDDRVVWFHCASLGEFEQGRPLIEKLKSTQPGLKILLTFFSPSGYEKRKNYRFADVVCYLPLDTPGNARDFVRMIPIEKAVFIKYEFWYYYLKALQKKGADVFLASGVFRHDHFFFAWYGLWFRKVLIYFTHIFVQDHSSDERLKAYGIGHVTIAGDTRFDRVLKVAAEPERFDCLDAFSSGKPVVVAGSTWEKDERLLSAAAAQLKDSCKWIVAPHEIDRKHIDRLRGMFPGSVLFSEILDRKEVEANMVVIDTIGHLSSLYQYGAVAYVGGGFGRGIHNILEPAAYGIPVFFGPNSARFNEAGELNTLQTGHPVRNTFEFTSLLTEYFEEPERLNTARTQIRQYFQEKAGATEILFNEIFQENTNNRDSLSYNL